MPDISKIKLNGTVYDIKDTTARATPITITNTLVDGALIATINSTNIYAPNDVATSQNAGLMSAQDKDFLDSLNPNMEATLTNINSSEFQIINAKQSNALNMVLTAEPVIEQQIRTSNLLDVNVFTSGFYIGSNGQLASNTNDNVGDFIPVSPGDDIYYTGIIGPTNSSSINRRLHVYKADKTWIKQISFAASLRVGQSWSTHGTVPSNGAYIRVSWGVEDTNVMISVGAPDKYYPYYITPFGTISEATFAVGPTTDREDATEYSVTVPAAAGTQYGFSYNPILGKLYTSAGHIASYNGETLPGIWWSDRDTYAEGATPSIGAEVIYRLADEDIDEYNITPITIPLGQYVNYFFVDGGQLKELSYYAQTLAINHLTISDGVSFGSTNILESDVIAWNNAASTMDGKANLDSPEFVGSPLAPNPSQSTNTTRIATTAYVQTKMSNLAPYEATSKVTRNYSAGDYVYIASYGKLFKVTAAVASGASFTVNTDIIETTIADELKALQAAIAAIQT